MYTRLVKELSTRLQNAATLLTTTGVAIALREAEESDQTSAFFEFVSKKYEFPCVPFMLAAALKGHLQGLIDSGLATRTLRKLPYGYAYKLTREGNDMVNEILKQFRPAEQAEG